MGSAGSSPSPMALACLDYEGPHKGLVRQASVVCPSVRLRQRTKLGLVVVGVPTRQGIGVNRYVTIGQHGTDDLSLRTKYPFFLKLSCESSLLTVGGQIIDVNFGLVAIPRIVASGQAGDVALFANGIVGGNEDRAEGFDCARNDGHRAEQTCRPEPELLGLRSRQIAEE